MLLVMVSYLRDLLKKSDNCQLQKNVPLQSMLWSSAMLLGVVICSYTDFGFLFVLTCSGNFSLICFKAWSEVIGTFQSCSDWPKKGANLLHTKPRKDFWGKFSHEVSILVYFLVKLVSFVSEEYFVFSSGSRAVYYLLFIIHSKYFPNFDWLKAHA